MHYSDLVKLRFGKAADTYDSSASTHVEIARHLVSMIQRAAGLVYSSGLRSDAAECNCNAEAFSIRENACAASIVTLVDVGAGTGILSEELLKVFPSAKLTLVDISSEMLARAEEKYHERMSYINANAEDLSIRGFDMLVSSMAMQWFRDIESFLIENMKYTRTIAFALPILGTFDEWYDLLEAHGIESHRMPYKSFDKMMSLCNLADHFIAEEKTYPLTFKSALDFVKYLKLIGASASRTGVYSYKESASILQALHAFTAVGAESGSNVTWATSYRVFFGVLYQG
ncbi:hypothetical protein FACS189449_09040 [Alphaproteobacteria bacterium]|nr:hypothetical protein FACS189449_09040 [Alphaproteobacteria bacterium]